MVYVILVFIMFLCGAIWFYQHHFPALDDNFCYGIEQDTTKFSKSEEIKLACEFICAFCAILLAILLAAEFCG